MEGKTQLQQNHLKEALDEYLQALDYSYKHNINEQRVHLRTSCALICLKLQMYNDAYNHSKECVQLDADNSTVSLAIAQYYC